MWEKLKVNNKETRICKVKDNFNKKVTVIVVLISLMYFEQFIQVGQYSGERRIGMGLIYM